MVLREVTWQAVILRIISSFFLGGLLGLELCFVSLELCSDAVASACRWASRLKLSAVCCARYRHSV